MRRIKIVTDSTSYITKEYIEQEDISVVPLNYTFGDDSYKEGFRGEFDDFFNKLENTNLFPTTSQPSTGDFLKVFEESLKEYDEVIAILLSSKISGTYNSAVLARDILNNDKITIIDSINAASNLRFLVEDAINMIKENLSSKDIISHIEKKKKSITAYLTTDSLEYLKRGGRLSSLQSIVGNLLNIKPIIQLTDGELKLLEKLRGKNKAISKIVSYIDEDIERISICYTLNIEDANKLRDKLIKEFPQAIITVDELGPVIGAHLGPNALGVCLY